MRLPKWSIIASVAIIVITVVIIVLPGKKEDEPQIIEAVELQDIYETASSVETTGEQSEDLQALTEDVYVAEEIAETEENTDDSEIAKRLSTDEHANATDFEWFMDMELFEGNEAGVIVTEPGRVERITGADNVLLNGGWKAYQLDTIKEPYNPETIRYYNVDIDTEGGKFNITMNWAYMFMPEAGESVEETGNDLFEGAWDSDGGTATAQSKWAKVEFDNFYIASDKNAEYATGTFYWISGEIERIALMRVAK